MTILIFVIILLVLVMVHELGHFVIAKLTGCRVDEFAFGFPPTIWKKKWGETEYKFNAIPIGGYVKIWGEDGNDGMDKRAFNNRPKWAQIAVLLAGVTMNWVLALVIFFVIAKSNATVAADDPVYANRVIDAKLIVVDVGNKSPAERSGIKPGYELLEVTSSNEIANLKSADNLKAFFTKHIDQDIHIKWKNKSDRGESIVTGVYGIIEKKKAIGISFESIGNVKLNAWESVKYSAANVWLYTKMTVMGLGDLAGGIVRADKEVLNGVSGPVGIAKIVGDQAREGSVSNVFALAAILSINLAVFNLLPFPALDGGRIIMVIYEAIRRKKIKTNIAAIINGVGFLCLILLIIIVTINDIFK